MAAASAGALAGALGGPLAGAMPVRAAANPVILQFAPWGQWTEIGAKWQEFLRPGLEPFAAANPNIRVDVVAPGGGGSFVTPILAGQGPDVFEDWVIPPYLAQNLVLNLQPFLQQDNLNVSLWSPGQIRALSTPGGLWFLPCYVHVDAMAVNLTDLDNLGLPYPSPDWTYEDAAKLYRAATWDKNGQHHYGYGFDIPANGGAIGYGTSDTRAFFLHWFGGSLMDEARTTCTLDAPASVRAVEWLDALVQDKVATSGGSIYGNGATTFAEVGSNNLPAMLSSWRNNIRWTFFPMPRYPAGQFAFEATDYHAISAATRHPEQAWLLLRFLAADPRWSRYAMRLLLRTPSLLSLWDEYVATVKQVAPPAVGKGVHWFTTAAEQWGVAGRTFRYQQDVAINYINAGLTAAVTRQQSVPLALKTAAQQVNALERAGVSEQRALMAAEASTQATLARVRPGPGTAYPAPPVQGLGVPPTSATHWVQAGAAGAYTLLGDGSDVWGTSNNCVFACFPATATVGQWTCRVVALTNLTCESGGKPMLSPWARIGLMAAADLSDDPPFVALAVTGGNLLQAEYRPVPAVTPEGPAGLAPSVGGKPISKLTAPVTTPVANFLLAPVWLRLQRDGDLWSVFASMDGRQWTALQPPTAVRMAACWVGVFANAHNSDFGNVGYIRGVVDALSFTPTRFVQVGQSGVPPQAGKVPTAWATMPPAGT